MAVHTGLGIKSRLTEFRPGSRVLRRAISGGNDGHPDRPQPLEPAMPIFSHTVTGYLFALLATVVWSGNFVVARSLAGALSPVELSFWRWSIAFLTILPFAARSLLRSLPLVRGTWGKVILMALLGITCFNTFIYQAGHTLSLIHI